MSRLDYAGCDKKIEQRRQLSKTRIDEKWKERIPTYEPRTSFGEASQDLKQSESPSLAIVQTVMFMCSKVPR